MSSFLYRIGRACYRARFRVIAAWLAVLIAIAALTATVGGKFDDGFHIPGASSQAAFDQLKMSFPEAALVSADVIVIAGDGKDVNDPTIRTEIEQGIQEFKRISFVDSVMNPWTGPVEGLVTSDGKAALIRVLLTKDGLSITDADRAQLKAAADAVGKQVPGAEVHIGGAAFSIDMPHLSWVEALGVGVAVVVLLVTLGSLAAATFPLIGALAGAGMAVMTIVIAAGVIAVNSTTMLLALMLALAVGIDYSLFIIARHRDQLAEGMDVEESAARAVGTAGSAVMFAGLTVIVALVGLFISGIPFLTIMGMFAAFAVALEVGLAITLLPALMGWAGERLRPKAAKGGHRPSDLVATGKASRWWINVVTAKPWVVIAIVIVLLGALTYPAKNLSMALPNSGRHTVDTPDRQTFDLVAKHFGVGYNGILVVTGTIVESTDPLGIADGIKAEIEKLPGVQSVPLSTPNKNADTLFVQVVPNTGPDDPKTEELVQALRDLAPKWQDKYQVKTAVTGFTAMSIDVSNRLSQALAPFAIFVVGLSLVLLLLVFRSIWVPIKAALGYILSVGGAFGATTLVFNEGWFKQVINLPETLPVISFMPIIVMGILFGLAMDYEVFLVSRMREEFVHGNREHFVADGFVHSSKVVVAAAIIMFAVFAFFVPSSQGPVKPIAFALAIGVAIDAFLVRMTLVPAVMKLLGPRAWWLPAWLEARLPVMDIEGETLSHQLSLVDWPSADSTHVVYAEDLTLQSETPARFDPMSISLQPGEVAIVRGPTAARRAVLYALTGRLKFSAGRAKVAGFVLPEQASQVRRTAACLTNASDEVLARAGRAAPPLLALDWPPPTATEATRKAAVDLVANRGDTALLLACGLDTDLAATLGIGTTYDINTSSTNASDIDTISEVLEGTRS